MLHPVLLTHVGLGAEVSGRLYTAPHSRWQQQPCAQTVHCTAIWSHSQPARTPYPPLCCEPDKVAPLLTCVPESMCSRVRACPFHSLVEQQSFPLLLNRIQSHSIDSNDTRQQDPLLGEVSLEWTQWAASYSRTTPGMSPDPALIRCLFHNQLL